MKTVQLGVVGCGAIGPTHMRAALESPHVELAAVADLVGERVQKAAADFCVPKTYRQGDELIRDPDVQAVVLAVPAGDRMDMGSNALKAGKHVLVEKPVAVNSGVVRRMIEARGDLVAGCCSCRYSLYESARVARDVVSSGALGDLRVVHCRALSAAGSAPERTPPSWRVSRERNGGGILVNWGCYDLDYLLGVTGWSLEPRMVLAQVWPVASHLAARVAPGSDAETHCAALVQCEGGVAISIERAEFCAAASEEAWQIVGTKGSLRLEMTAGQKAVIHDDTISAEGVVSQTIWEGEEGMGPALNGPVADFAEAVCEGREPATSLQRALVVQQITDAIYASAESGRAVQIS